MAWAGALYLADEGCTSRATASSRIVLCFVAGPAGGRGRDRAAVSRGPLVGDRAHPPGRSAGAATMSNGIGYVVFDYIVTALLWLAVVMQRR